MAASNDQLDKYTRLNPEQHARFMQESAVRKALEDFRKKLEKEEKAKQGQTTESPISAFFSNLSNPFATLGSSPSSNAAQSTPTSVSDVTPIIKILIYGDNRVNKSALANHFSGNVGQKSKELELEGKRVKAIFVEVDDNRFACRPPQWMKDAHVICLCYNVHNQDSFDHIEKYKQEINHEALPNVKVILVADKSNLSLAQERVVTREEGEQLGKELNVPHIEILIETGEECDKLLEEAARLGLQTRSELANAASSSSSSSSFGLGKRP
jgi:GTPase SAR1 family protein